MNNQKILTLVKNFTDDEPDSDMVVELANMAKGKLEAELKLEITKKLNTSLMSSVGGTHLTSYSLAGIDYFELFDYIYVGNDKRTRVPYERHLQFKDDSSKYYINLAAGTLHLCGTINAAETITIPYIYETPEIVNDDSTVVVWPPRFHMLIPMEVARMWPAIEGGDKARAWDDRWTAFYASLKNALIDWDGSQKLAAIGGQTPYGPETSEAGEYQINI